MPDDGTQGHVQRHGSAGARRPAERDARLQLADGQRRAAARPDRHPLRAIERPRRQRQAQGRRADRAAHSAGECRRLHHREPAEQAAAQRAGRCPTCPATTCWRRSSIASRSARPRHRARSRHASTQTMCARPTGWACGLSWLRLDPTRGAGNSVGGQLRQDGGARRNAGVLLVRRQPQLQCATGRMTATPIEFGATNLISSDPIKHSNKGAIGALIIEPSGCDLDLRTASSRAGRRSP